jgi:hypothetical protein
MALEKEKKGKGNWSEWVWEWETSNETRKGNQRKKPEELEQEIRREKVLCCAGLPSPG